MEIRTCPICGESYEGYPALSREDNKTKICPRCGMREALEIASRYVKPFIEKKENKNEED